MDEEIKFGDDEAKENKKTKNEKKIYELKIIVVGDHYVGKTTLLYRYINNKFNEYMTSIAVDFLKCNIELDDKILKLILMDTAGTEQFRSLTKGYYSNACCALIVYDITDVNSFNSVNQWIKDCNNFAQKGTHLVLVGNKIDLENQRKISTEDGKNLAIEYNMDFYESSAKTGENISNIFEGICKIMNKKIDGGIDSLHGVNESNIQENIIINKNLSNNKKKCC